MPDAQNPANWFKCPTKSQLAIFTVGWVAGNALLLAAAINFFADFHQWHDHFPSLLLMRALATWGVMGLYGNYLADVKKIGPA